MKIKLIQILILAASTSVFAENCFDNPWTSKAGASAIASVCPANYQVNGVNFYHAVNENLTWQESFSVRCCPSRIPTIPNTDFSDAMALKSNLVTRKAAAQGTMIAGIAFEHPVHQNYTYQESVALVLRRLRPHGFKPTSCYQTANYSKGGLVTNALCNRPRDFVAAVTLSHPLNQNLTYQESVSLECCSPQ